MLSYLSKNRCIHFVLNSVGGVERRTWRLAAKAKNPFSTSFYVSMECPATFADAWADLTYEKGSKPKLLLFTE